MEISAEVTRSLVYARREFITLDEQMTMDAGK